MPAENLSAVIGDWICELEARRVLRRKPGGFVWLNSQLRKLLAARLKSDWVTGDQYEPWGDAMLRIGSLIARWYGRVLLGSTDPLAGVEGVHHALEVVRSWAEIVGPMDPAGLTRVAVALKHAELLLRTARPLFERRLSSQFADQSLDALQREAEETLGTFLVSFRIQKIQSLLINDLQSLIHGIVRLRSVVALRESEYRRAIALAQSPFFTKACQTNESQRATLERDLRMNAAGALVCQRRYREAEMELMALWTDTALPAVNLDDKRFEAARQWIATKAGSNLTDSDTTALKCFAARLARWRLYLLLNCSQVRYLAARSTTALDSSLADPSPLRHTALRQALWFYDFGIEILRAVPAVEDRFVFEENVRLRAHAALCRGILEINLGNTGMARASTLLADGSAYFGEFPLNGADINTAILNLRRAELPLLTVGNEPGLKEFRNRLLEWSPDEPFSADFLFSLPTTLLDNAGILTTAARVYDALWHLEAAEEQLNCHPKSRWWWAIYSVLKMKATEHLYTLRLLRELRGFEGQREPYLIAPDAIRFLYGDLVEIVRAKGIGDAFYLTRIFHSYARTIRAQLAYLHARAASATSRGDLQARWLQRAQHVFINRRHDLLTLVVAARRALAPAPQPDEIVLNYFESCYEDAIKVIRFYPSLTPEHNNG